MTESRTLLVVAAHPDDEVLGCGATVRRLADCGWTVHLALLTRGIAGRSTGSSTSVAAAQERLREERTRAAEILGFAGCDSFDFPDNRLDTVSRMDLTHAISPLLEKLRPTRLLTHHPGDYNWDHTRVFDAVMMAARASPGDPTPDEIWTFEVPSSTERAWQHAGRAFCPTIFVDASATLEAKKSALACYESELREPPHPRSLEGVEAWARRRGAEVGLAHAEAFALIRRIDRGPR